jgi:hypothetical protein
LVEDGVGEDGAVVGFGDDAHFELFKVGAGLEGTVQSVSFCW